MKKMSLVAELLYRAAGDAPERSALFFPDENLRLNFAQVFERAENTARALLGAGVRRGDHIGIWSTNCAHWADLIFGASMIGVITVPVNTSYRFLELRDICVRADLDMLFVMEQCQGEDCQAVIGQFRKAQDGRYLDCPKLRSIVSMGENGMEDCLAWEEFYRLRDEVDVAAVWDASAFSQPEDIYVIQYTSGTTAAPKGAMLTYAGVSNTANAYVARMHMQPEDVIFAPIPLFHCFGNVLTLLGGIIARSVTIYPERFRPVPSLEVIEAEGVTQVMAVPTMFMETLDRTRPSGSAAALGICQSAIEQCIAYGRERKTFGRPIISNQGLQFMLADMEIQTQAARTLTLQVASRIDDGIVDASFGAVTKTFVSDTAVRVALDAIQIFGGYGYTREYPVEILVRNAKIFQIFEGTNQIQRMVIAGSLIGRL